MLQKVATTGVDLDSVYDQTLRRIKEQGGGAVKAWDGGADVGIPRGTAAAD